jgi:hypothetical protein
VRRILSVILTCLGFNAGTALATTKDANIVEQLLEKNILKIDTVNDSVECDSRCHLKAD